MRKLPKKLEDWNVYEWEKSFKVGDKLANICFSVLDKYQYLPQNADLFRQVLEKEYAPFDERMIISDYIFPFDDQEEEEDQEEVITAPSDPKSFVTPEQVIMDIENERIFKIYLTLKNISRNWSNVFSLLTEPDDQLEGTKVLYYLGRSLSLLLCIINSKTKLKPENISISKRVTDHLNTIIGYIDRFRTKDALPDVVMENFYEDISFIHEQMVDHLLKLK